MALRWPFYFTHYLGTYLPPLFYQSTPTRGQESSIEQRQIDQIFPIARVLRRVEPIPREDLEQDVREFNKSIPATDIDAVPPLFPHRNTQSWLALKVNDAEHDRLPLTPEETYLRSNSGLDYFRNTLLPTFHFAMRTIAFGKLPQLNLLDMFKGREALFTKKGVEGDDQLQYVSTATVQQLAADEEGTFAWSWQPVSFDDIIDSPNLVKSDMTLWRWFNPSTAQTSLVLAYIPPWILTPQLFDHLVAPREVPEELGNDVPSGLRRLQLYLDKLVLVCSRMQASHFIVATHNQWAFADFATEPSGKSDYSIVRISPPVPYSSMEREIFPKPWPRGPFAGLRTRNAQDQKIVDRSTIGIAEAWPISVMQAVTYWLDSSMSRNGPLHLPTPPLSPTPVESSLPGPSTTVSPQPSTPPPRNDSGSAAPYSPFTSPKSKSPKKRSRELDDNDVRSPVKPSEPSEPELKRLRLETTDESMHSVEAGLSAPQKRASAAKSKGKGKAKAVPQAAAPPAVEAKPAPLYTGPITRSRSRLSANDVQAPAPPAPTRKTTKKRSREDEEQQPEAGPSSPKKKTKTLRPLPKSRPKAKAARPPQVKEEEPSDPILVPTRILKPLVKPTINPSPPQPLGPTWLNRERWSEECQAPELDAPPRPRTPTPPPPAYHEVMREDAARRRRTTAARR